MKVAIFQLQLFGVNCYVVYDPEEKKAAIVDPGIIDPREVDAIDAFLKKNGLEVVAVINTHMHIDHAIANHELATNYNVPVMAHPDDEFLGAGMAAQARQFGLPIKVNPGAIDRPLKDGDIIPIGSGQLEVIHVPGHSPGGVALYDRKDGFLISGDTLFDGSIGRSDLPGGDLARLLESVKKKLYTLPDSTVVYPGHGGPTTIAKEKSSNPFVQA